jgi:hypothetical protein
MRIASGRPGRFCLTSTEKLWMEALRLMKTSQFRTPDDIESAGDRTSWPLKKILTNGLLGKSFLSSKGIVVPPLLP